MTDSELRIRAFSYPVKTRQVAAMREQYENACAARKEALDRTGKRLPIDVEASIDSLGERVAAEEKELRRMKDEEVARSADWNRRQEILKQTRELTQSAANLSAANGKPGKSGTLFHGWIHEHVLEGELRPERMLLEAAAATAAAVRDLIWLDRRTGAGVREQATAAATVMAEFRSAVELEGLRLAEQKEAKDGD